MAKDRSIRPTKHKHGGTSLIPASVVRETLGLPPHEIAALKPIVIEGQLYFRRAAVVAALAGRWKNRLR